MIAFGPNVTIVAWNDRLGDYFHTLQDWSSHSGIDPWITSVDNGRHGERSFHGYSLAVDSSVEGNVRAEIALLYEFLRRHLSPEWEVICESDHVHSEWDIHRKIIIL